MNAEERRAVQDARALGVGVLHNLLTGAELQQARAEFDQAQAELAAELNVRDKPWGTPGTRDSLWGEKLLAYPAIARIFTCAHDPLAALGPRLLTGGSCTDDARPQPHQGTAGDRGDRRGA